jgi:hypothetical protein
MESRFIFPPPRQNSWTAKGDIQSTQDQYNRDAIIHYVIAEKKEHSDDKGEKPKTSNEKNWFLSLLCGEAKITDVALVFFTYCLVIVGWFTMQNVDDTAKRTERAYILGGGPYGIPRDYYRPDKQWQHWPEAKHFHDPRRMTIQNYGKTPGFITEVEWGLCPPESFPKVISVSQALDDPTFHRHFVRTVEYPMEVFQPNTAWLPYRHVEFDRKENVGKILFGRIRYKDVFHKEHYSTFKLLLDERFSQALDNAYAEDWS